MFRFRRMCDTSGALRVLICSSSFPNFLGAMNGFIEELLDARAYVAGPASHPQGFVCFQVSIVFADCVPRELDISCGSRPRGMFLAFSYSLVGDGLCYGG